MVNLQINTVKYNVHREIMNSLIFVFHPSTNNCLYLVTFENIRFIDIRIQLVR
jgi:hypothetical protein